MVTRGILRSIIPPGSQKPIALRASGGPSILKELSNEQIAVDIDDAVRLNASALAVQVFIGGEYETQSVINMTRLVDAGIRAGIPVMAVTAVGKELARTPRYFRLATRMCAELGAHFIKTYYVEKEFDTIVSCCPVPIVIAGGKKLPEPDALKMCYNAIQQGAAGVDMGRNIFQAPNPVAMIQAGEATLHVGGEIVDAKTTAPGEVRGSAIKGGKTMTLKAGDTVNIPPLTPHHVTIAAGKSVTYMIVKVKK
jgi:putative autoinducer-2 (AI-2) aldolase